MSNNVTVTVDTKKLNQILKQLPGNRDKAVRAIAFSIERKAKMKAPVDTGALRASIYTRTAKGSYSSNEQMSGIPEIQGDAVRETLPPVKEGEAVVGPSVEYGIHVEFGTRRQRSQAYLGPAVNSTAKELAEHLKGVCTDEVK